MTLNPFCIAGGESGTLTTHLYLRLSMVFRELRIHALIYTQGGRSNGEKYRATEGERQRNVEKQRKNDREGERSP